MFFFPKSIASDWISTLNGTTVAQPTWNLVFSSWLIDPWPRKMVGYCFFVIQRTQVIKLRTKENNNTRDTVNCFESALVLQLLEQGPS